jgi:dephospho-CoA kinase
MVLLGLTGSIGMGKSTAATMFGWMGVPVHDADAEVHRLYASDACAKAAIEAAFPGSVRDGRIDRQALGAQVIGRPEALRRLERIVHPRLAMRRRRFLEQAARRRRPVVVLDVPLLFETGGQRRVDLTLVVTAPAFIQRQRVLRRAGMTAEKLAGILARQMPDAQKRRRADFIVPTGLGRRPTLVALRRILTAVTGRRGRHWPPKSPFNPRGR